jgi:hypothetical protein
LARQKLQQRNETQQQQEQAEASASSGNEDEAAGVIAAENRPPPPIRKNFEGSSWEKVCTDLDLVILYYFISRPKSLIACRRSNWGRVSRRTSITAWLFVAHGFEVYSRTAL